MSNTHNDVLVDGEDSSEEEDDIIANVTSTTTTSSQPQAAVLSGKSAAFRSEFDPAAFVKPPTNPIHASVQEGMLPQVHAQLVALRRLMQEHEDLLGDINRERGNLGKFVREDLRAAQDVLNQVPSYEAKIRGMLAQMAQMNGALDEMTVGSEAMMSEVAANVEVSMRRPNCAYVRVCAGVCGRCRHFFHTHTCARLWMLDADVGCGCWMRWSTLHMRLHDVCSGTTPKKSERGGV